MPVILVRLLVAVLIYYLGSVLIDTIIKDASVNQIFKIVLLIICLLIVFAGNLVGL